MNSNLYKNDDIICVVGLGYVGLPLAIHFSKYYKVIGYDTDHEKVKKLKTEYSNFEISSHPSIIKKANFIIITVPTPLTKSKEPDLSYVKTASKTIGENLQKGATVVLESTVYPGVTEEIVAPILEETSGYKLGKDFTIGYSPERINPGDKKHELNHITKIVAGMDKQTTQKLAELYDKITTVYCTEDIKTAEAAKVIENIQRDINIALMNELALICNKLNIDIKEVLNAAQTKWNFVRFDPGMVGGHCIPIDPYYLVHKAKDLGYHAQVILAGRSINDFIPKHVAMTVLKGLNEAGKVIRKSKVLIMGLTYKKNVPDTRESPVKTIIEELHTFDVEIYGYDPLLDENQTTSFDLTIINELKGKYDCIIITVMHDQFKKLTLDQLKKHMIDKPLLIDVRRIFDKDSATKKGFIYKSL